MSELFKDPHLGPLLREFLRLQEQVAAQSKTISKLEGERDEFKLRLRHFIDVRKIPEYQFPGVLHCDVRIESELACEMDFEELVTHVMRDAVRAIKEKAV